MNLTLLDFNNATPLCIFYFLAYFWQHQHDQFQIIWLKCMKDVNNFCILWYKLTLRHSSGLYSLVFNTCYYLLFILYCFILKVTLLLPKGFNILPLITNIIPLSPVWCPLRFIPSLFFTLCLHSIIFCMFTVLFCI